MTPAPRPPPLMPATWRTGSPAARASCSASACTSRSTPPPRTTSPPRPRPCGRWPPRSEEHTSELQSRVDLVCRLLLEKKKLVLAVAALSGVSLLLGPTRQTRVFHTCYPVDKQFIFAAQLNMTAFFF